MNDSIYIPVGQTVTYEELHVQNIIVDGTLKVSGNIEAGRIRGKGFLAARRVACDEVCLRTLEIKEELVARRAALTKLISRQCYVNDVLVVKSFIRAEQVKTGRLVVALSEITGCDAKEVVVLPPRSCNMLWFLLRARLRSWWIALTTPPEKEKKIARAKKSAAPKSAADAKAQSVQHPAELGDAPDAEILNSVIAYCEKRKEELSAMSAEASGQEKAA